jgi:hypothetical protein
MFNSLYQLSIRIELLSVLWGALDSVVGWGSIIEEVIGFSIYLIIPAALWP